MKNSRINKWIEDIEQFKSELPKRHKNLFFKQNKNKFHSQIEDLKQNLENYDNYTIIVSMAQIVASIRDAHTTLIIPAASFLPLEFYWFEEGIYIIATSNKNKNLLNCKVTHIDGIPIDDIIQGFEGIISHENNSFFKAYFPKYLPVVEVLYGLEIIDEFTQVKLRVEGLNGESFEETIDNYQNNEFQREIINVDDDSKYFIPLYRKNSDKNFWSYFIKSHNTLYFKYNKCKDMEDISVKTFCINLMEFINNRDVKKLVIDLRNNLGGDSTLLEPFIMELSKCEKLNKKDGIFVILGRDTFSSALLNAYVLKNETMAVFIGEATGGKPNCYGEVRYFTLKNSRIGIRYSTKYYKLIEDDEQQSFFPEINFEITFKDYLANKDACLEYILNKKNIEEQKTIVKKSIAESQNLFNSLMSKYFE
jgi:hypothetical protein